MTVSHIRAAYPNLLALLCAHCGATNGLATFGTKQQSGEGVHQFTSAFGFVVCASAGTSFLALHKQFLGHKRRMHTIKNLIVVHIP